MQKTVFALAGGTVCVIVAVAVYLATAASSTDDMPATPAALQIGDAKIGGPFTLTDQTGTEVASAELIDGPTLLYFGYTFCPDICPIDTQVMVDAVDLLDEKGVEVTPVFITVDPERDTPAELKLWAEAMHPDLVALSGSEENIAAAAKAYGVYYQRQEVPDSDLGYLFSHTGYTYLVTPEGTRAVFRNGYPPEEIVKETMRVVGGS